MWGWFAGNWMGLVALLLSLDAERRLYASVDWSLTETGDGEYLLRNEGWLTERDVMIHGVPHSEVRHELHRSLKRHETMRVHVARAEGNPGRNLRISSRRFLLRHSRTLAL